MKTSPDLPTERQQRAQEYARLRRSLFFVEQALTLIGIVFVLVSGLSVWLRAQAESVTTNPALVVALYVISLGGAYTLVTLPLDVYSGYVLPHRFGLSRQTLGAWVADQIKAGLLSAAFTLVFIEGLYVGLLQNAPETWWLWGAVAVSFLSLFLIWLGPVILQPLFNTFTPLADTELRERLLRLAAKTGVRVQGIFVVDFSRRTSAANAYVTGIGNTHRVVLGDTLIQNFTHDEIETVMAHEMGHYVKHDTWRLFAASVVFIAAVFGLANVVLRWGVGVFGLRGIADIAGLPLFGLVFALFGLLTLPLFNAYSRRIEYAADVYELALARDPAAFIRAMQKLQNQNLGEADPPRWAVLLFYSHPPVKDRINHAERYARAHGLDPYPLAS